MIEDMEECVLCAWHVLQILDVIDNESVDALIEMEEAVYVLAAAAVYLALE